MNLSDGNSNGARDKEIVLVPARPGYVNLSIKLLVIDYFPASDSILAVI